ncbi:MAG: efflux RND transporter periplasmic adaptor subunit [Bacteroidales bacterium]|jgi:RND family efflux transporter MFP subunit|nr:efflux RND transporter periplasmic adaptor subunit [Bacteroidales bacterium]
MKKTICLALMVSLLSGCNTKQTQEKLPAEKSIAITVSEVRSEHVVVNLRYSGTVEPSQTIPLNFQTTGTVETVLIDAGDAVKKGQLMATLDKNDMQNLYEITKAKYQQAKDGYDRLKTVHDQGSLTEVKWVEMETNIEQAKSLLELSRSNLEKCSLHSPMDGIIGHRNIEPGMSSLGISSPFELVQIASVYVKISVPENEIAKMKKGLKADIVVSALNDKKFSGEITIVSPIADVFARTYEVKITVNNSNLELKPGMVCDVTLNLTTEKELMLIPYQSVTQDNDGKHFVYVVDAARKRVKKQLIEIGNYRGTNLEVLSGLTQGQTIVCEGKEKLCDNTLISF